MLTETQVGSLRVSGDRRKDCCKNPHNLGPVVKLSQRSGIVFQRCTVCNCRHFEMTLDPGKLGLRGSNL